MPNDQRRENILSLQELREVFGEIIEAIAGLRMPRITVAPLCQSDCMNGSKKVSENRFEFAPGACETVLEYYGNCRWVYPFHVGKPHIVWQLNALNQGSNLEYVH